MIRSMLVLALVGLALVGLAQTHQSRPEPASPPAHMPTAPVAHGADPNARDPHGRSALFYAGGQGVVLALLSAGADPGLLDETGKNFFTAAEPDRQRWLSRCLPGSNDAHSVP
ncbi:MAG: hypothetical protein KC910_23750 [Candidatus Eremiobacteraeota bacterium]|nr:hypothetical protein [Candidatus Eremiobacteraeota bacterium]